MWGFLESRSRNLEEELVFAEPARKYINIRGCVPGWRRERERVGLVERKGEVIRGVEYTLRVLAVCTASPAGFGCFSGSQDSGPIARSADFFFFRLAQVCSSVYIISSCPLAFFLTLSIDPR